MHDASRLPYLSALALPISNPAARGERMRNARRHGLGEAAHGDAGAALKQDEEVLAHSLALAGVVPAAEGPLGLGAPRLEVAAPSDGAHARGAH